MTKLIYLASPYSHPDPNVRHERWTKICAIAAELLCKGYHVISPIAHTHPMALVGQLPFDWDFWAVYDENIITRCDELWIVMLGGWSASKGLKAEREIAGRLKKPVVYLTERKAKELPKVAHG